MTDKAMSERQKDKIVCGVVCSAKRGAKKALENVSRKVTAFAAHHAITGDQEKLNASIADAVSKAVEEFLLKHRETQVPT